MASTASGINSHLIKIQINVLSESRADLTLAAAVRLLEPLLPLLLREGVTYPRLSNALKKAFLEVAPGVLLDSSIPLNDSSVSTLTGIHRKDVREWRSAGQPRAQARTFGASDECIHPLVDRS